MFQTHEEPKGKGCVRYDAGLVFEVNEDLATKLTAGKKAAKVGDPPPQFSLGHKLREQYVSVVADEALGAKPPKGPTAKKPKKKEG
jgi:hypothetical protein